MIELQNLWNEIEDQLSDELDDQDVDFPDIRESSSSRNLISELSAYDSEFRFHTTKQNVAFINTEDLKSSILLPTTDNLLAQFFGEYAYEFDQFSEDTADDSDTNAEPSSLTSSLSEEVIVSESPKSVRLPNSGDEETLIVPSSMPTSPELSPDSPKSIVEEPVTSPSLKRRMSLEDDEINKRQCLTDSQTTMETNLHDINDSRSYLLHIISNVLPPSKLSGVVDIVNSSTTFQQSESDDGFELEFDINTLEESTLKRLEEYVRICLQETLPNITTSTSTTATTTTESIVPTLPVSKRKTSSSKKTKRKSRKGSSRRKELRMSLETMGEVLTMKHDSANEDEDELIDIVD